MRRTSGLLIAVVFSALAQGADYLPLTIGNTWTLSSLSTSTPVKLTVLSTTETNDEKHSSVALNTPWGDYTLLIKVTTLNGVELEGLVINGSSSRFPEPGAFFPNPSGSQTVWSTAATTVTLVDQNLSTLVGGKQYTGVRFYRVRFSDQSVQSWYLAPDVGFLQFGEGPYAFKLSSYNINPYVSQLQVTMPSPCPTVGIDANPAANGDFSFVGHENRLKQAISAGSRLLQINASWAQLEPSPNQYNLTGLKAYFGWADTYGLDAVLTIRTVDSFSISLPVDLVGKPLSDAAVQLRFANLLNAIAPLMSSRVRWVNVANEVDIYYASRQSELPALKSFLASASAQLKSLRPSLLVGVVFSYDSYRLFDGTYKAIEPLCDQVSFTYYSTAAGFTQRAPSSALTDIPSIAAAAHGKPLILTEIGYASAANGSTSADQKAFITNVFKATSMLGSAITAMSFYQMSDLPISQLASFSSTYDNTNAFANYAGSLGLFDTSNVAKPAWPEFQTDATKFQQANYCTVDVPSTN